MYCEKCLMPRIKLLTSNLCKFGQSLLGICVTIWIKRISNVTLHSNYKKLRTFTGLFKTTKEPKIYSTTKNFDLPWRDCQRQPGQLTTSRSTNERKASFLKGSRRQATPNSRMQATFTLHRLLRLLESHKHKNRKGHRQRTRLRLSLALSPFINDPTFMAFATEPLNLAVFYRKLVPIWVW
jgi:hypothetical protein